MKERIFKKGIKRVLSIIVMTAMVLTLVPSMSVEVKAEEPTPLTFTAEEAGATMSFEWITGSNVKIKPSSTNVLVKGTPVENTEWQDYTAGDIITLPNVDDFVSFKGLNVVTDDQKPEDGGSHHFSMSGKIKASGDVTSLTNEIGGDATLSERCYWAMFKDCTALTSAPKLPSTTLSKTCYWNMFSGCTALISAPELPSKNLAYLCYGSMFYRCTSLASAPELPATTIPESAYQNMFSYCESLINPPALPAKTLAGQDCYSAMFQYCTSLTSVPELPATSLHNYCYRRMFRGCTNLEMWYEQTPEFTAAWKIPAKRSLTQSITDMFYDCPKVKLNAEGTKIEPDLNTYYYFKPTGDPHNITVSDDGHGTVEAKIAGVTSTTAQKSVLVKLTATPDAGYEFDKWESSDATVTADNELIMPDKDVTVTAKFKIIPVKYTVTVNNDGNGTASADLQEASVGSTVTLTANPNTGYELDKWEVTPSTLTVSSNKFTMPAENTTVKAIFKKKIYQITANSGSNGQVEVSVGGTTKSEATMGEQVTVAATPNSGYVFDSWNSSDITIPAGTGSSFTFTMPAEPVTITANFAIPVEHDITVSSGGNGTVTASETKAISGTTVTLSVKPDTGYVFDIWECTGIAASSIVGNKFTMPNEAVTITARFKKDTPKPTPSKSSSDSEPTKVFVDLDTNKSEVAYGTVFIHNKDNVKNIFDMKVHSVDAKTKANQEFLAAAYAKNQGKRARVLITTGIYPRNKLYAKDLGTKKFLSFVNLEKKVQPVYAVCYNQTDKAYYLTGTMNANGTAVFTDFIARDATNITIFVLE